jgi:hypothetical protein
MKSVKAFLIFLLLIQGCKKEDIPTVKTGDVASITRTTANCSGEILSQGDSEVTERGICWSTTDKPLISDNIKVDDSDGNSFTVELTGLEPGTEFFVRAYATNRYGTGYGETMSFITNSLCAPEVITFYPQQIRCNSASFGGEIQSDGGSPVIDFGICWSKSDNPTLNDSYFSVGGGSVSFRSTISELESNTDYYVSAYATNLIGITYGASVKFTTCPDLNPNPVNPKSISLFNQPLDTVKKYVQGKWQVVVIRGGVGGINSCYNNFFSEFTDNDLFITNVYAVANDTFNIAWVRENFPNSPDSFYLMNLKRFKDGANMDVSYVMQEIKNDTLVYFEHNMLDAFYYFGLRDN